MSRVGSLPVFLVLLCLAGTCTVAAEDGVPRLLRDISVPGSSFPAEFVALGDGSVFRALEPATGSELWRSDGSEAGTALVGDVNPAPLGRTRATWHWSHPLLKLF